MYRDLREAYCLDGLKKGIPISVSKFPNCKQVKVEHLMTSGIIQEWGVPTFKWEEINMYFVVGLPQILRKSDSI